MPKLEHPACGLCACRAHEVDQLVQLGEMGYICLSCLEVVAATRLPLMAIAPLAGGSASTVTPRADNVVQLAQHRAKQSAITAPSVVP